MFYLIENATAPDQLNRSGFLHKIQTNDLEISDLGFFYIATFADLDQEGAFYLSRLRTDVKLYHQTNNGLEEFDLGRFVKNLQFPFFLRENYT